MENIPNLTKIEICIVWNFLTALTVRQKSENRIRPLIRASNVLYKNQSASSTIEKECPLWKSSLKTFDSEE